MTTVDLETNAVPADVEPDAWSLRVTGAVARPLEFDRADLSGLPLETATDDFACVEGWTAEDLSWRGVRVRTLLERADPTDGADYALVRAMDGDYACAFRLDRLADAVLAVELDGEPLPVAHGGPARLVPTGDADCWESIKWATEIELAESDPSEADTAKRIALSRVD